MKDFRIKFVHVDGSLIQNRRVDPQWHSTYIRDPDFLSYSLKRDACEKGVKILNYTLSEDEGVTATVDWL